MPGDADALWSFLRGIEDAADEAAAAARPAIRRESLIRVLDAAVGVLAATRRFFEVTEEVVKEQRDRLAAADREGVPQAESGRTRIDLTY